MSLKKALEYENSDSDTIENKPYRNRVGIFVFDEHGKLGCGILDSGDIHHPGGGIELGQSISDAAKTEALEELGFEIENLVVMDTVSIIEPFPVHSNKSSERAKKYRGIKAYNVVCVRGKENKSLYGAEDDMFDITFKLSVEEQLENLGNSEDRPWKNPVIDVLRELIDNSKYDWYTKGH